MASGGKRAGAGRKPGSQTVRTQQIATELGVSGISPLEVLVNSMRIAWEKSCEPEADEKWRQMAVSCAEKAAPYMHAKLANVAHTGADGIGPAEIVHRHMWLSDES